MTKPYRQRREIKGADKWLHPIMKPNEPPFCDMSIEEYEAWVMEDVARRRRQYWKEFFTGKRLKWFIEDHDEIWLVGTLVAVIGHIFALGWWASYLLTKQLGLTGDQAWAVLALVCIHQLAFGGNQCRSK